jgi:hypothetical protein
MVMPLPGFHGKSLIDTLPQANRERLSMMSKSNRTAALQNKTIKRADTAVPESTPNVTEILFEIAIPK